MKRDIPATNRLVLRFSLIVSNTNYFVIYVLFVFVLFRIQSKFAGVMTKLNPFRAANKVRREKTGSTLERMF